VVRFRGWVHRPRELGIKRLAAVVALAQYYRVRSDEYDIFLRRIYPFVVRNRAGRELDLVCSHLVSSAHSIRRDGASTGSSTTGTVGSDASNQPDSSVDSPSDFEEASECGPSVLGRCSSDHFGHFDNEAAVHLCELPLEVAQRLRLANGHSGTDSGASSNVSSILSGEVGQRAAPVAVVVSTLARVGAPTAAHPQQLAPAASSSAASSTTPASSASAAVSPPCDDWSSLGGTASSASVSSSSWQPCCETVWFVPPVGVSIVSDIDDTVKLTNVPNRDDMIRNTFMRDFQAVPGMSKLYQGWAEQGAAFHYVSSSPWQLAPEIAQLFALSGLPGGSFHLRHFDIRNQQFFKYIFTSSVKAKPRAIKRLLTTFPQRKFVLVGDSGEKDPEIYARLMREHPSQIAHVLIREVPGDLRATSGAVSEAQSLEEDEVDDDLEDECEVDDNGELRCVDVPPPDLDHHEAPEGSRRARFSRFFRWRPPPLPRRSTKQRLSLAAAFEGLDGRWTAFTDPVDLDAAARNLSTLTASSRGESINTRSVQ